jgi:hypothetical protein
LAQKTWTFFSRDLTNAERVYATLAGRLKLHARQREMNQRIDYCEDFSKTVHEMLNQKHVSTKNATTCCILLNKFHLKSHYLEWIIIVLIALEVVINWQRLWELLKSIWDSTKGTGKSIYGFLANIGYISSTTQPAVEKAGKNEVEEEDDKVTFTDYVCFSIPMCQLNLNNFFQTVPFNSSIYCNGRRYPNNISPRIRQFV